MIGIAQFLGGIGAILGKVSTYIPGRIEKLKNERIRLDDERRTLEILKLDIDKAEDRKKATHLSVCIKRIRDIDVLLGSKVND